VGEEILRVKIQRVKELLATTDLSLAAISARMGFSRPSTMHHAFKRPTGQTPREYRATVSPPLGGRRHSKPGLGDP
jgi:AraC-like DNA-binding protein